jgi:lipopolysaccharide transport system ATP-binding protein
VALSLSRLDSHLDRNFEWRDYGLVFHVINNRQEDFVGCSWLQARTSIQRQGLSTAQALPQEELP